MFKGSRLKKLREAKGLTQAELGSMIGVTKAAICFYEKSKRNPSYENIIDLMHIFKVSADFLLGADHFIKTETDTEIELITMTKEEVQIIEELRKDKFIYDILFDDPKRGFELIKNKIG